jgi:hypothetical protein
MRALLSILAIAAVTVGACHFGRTWFEVANETNEPLDIVYDRATGLTLVRDVPPGAQVNVWNPGEPRCTEHDVVARNQAGDEVARHGPPLCGGDVWTISDEP